MSLAIIGSAAKLPMNSPHQFEDRRMNPRTFIPLQHSATFRCCARALVAISVLMAGLGCSEKAHPPAGQIKVATAGIYAGTLDDRGNYAVIGSMHHGISYWRLSDEERLFNWSHKAATDTILAAADTSPDGNWALTADTNTLVLWDTKTGEASRYWQAPGEISSVQLSSGGNKALLGLADHTAVIFDVRRGGIIHTFNHKDRVHSVSLDDKGLIAATGSADYTAVTWDLQNNKHFVRMRHNDEVQLVVLSPDGSLVLSVSQYDKAIIWRSRDGQVVGEIPLKAGRVKRGLSFTSARFSPDNQFLLAGQTDQTISLWHLNDLKSPTIWKLGQRRLWKPAGAAVIDVAFSEEQGKFYAIASNGLVFKLTQKK